jgi:hypothetical protein
MLIDFYPLKEKLKFLIVNKLYSTIIKEQFQLNKEMFALFKLMITSPNFSNIINELKDSIYFNNSYILFIIINIEENKNISFLNFLI